MNNKLLTIMDKQLTENTDETLKILAMAAINNNNIKLAMDYLKLCSVGNIDSDYYQNNSNIDNNILLLLQNKTDMDPKSSYNTVLSYGDSYELKYEKIYVNLYLSHALKDSNISDKILEKYDGNILSLKQSLLFQIICGCNAVLPFSDFVTLADNLLKHGLDLDYYKLTYSGHFTTPLGYAKMLGYMKIYEYLIEHGAIN